MNRKIIAVVVVLAFVSFLVFARLAARSGRPLNAQKTEPVWKMTVTLPKTNNNPPLTNTLPKNK